MLLMVQTLDTEPFKETNDIAMIAYSFFSIPDSITIKVTH